MRLAADGYRLSVLQAPERHRLGEGAHAGDCAVANCGNEPNGPHLGVFGENRPGGLRADGLGLRRGGSLLAEGRALEAHELVMGAVELAFHGVDLLEDDGVGRGFGFIGEVALEDLRFQARETAARPIGMDQGVDEEALDGPFGLEMIVVFADEGLEDFGRLAGDDDGTSVNGRGDGDIPTLRVAGERGAGWPAGG